METDINCMYNWSRGSGLLRAWKMDAQPYCLFPWLMTIWGGWSSYQSHWFTFVSDGELMLHMKLKVRHLLFQSFLGKSLSCVRSCWCVPSPAYSHGAVTSYSSSTSCHKWGKPIIYWMHIGSLCQTIIAQPMWQTLPCKTDLSSVVFWSLK